MSEKKRSGAKVIGPIERLSDRLSQAEKDIQELRAQLLQLQEQHSGLGDK